MVLRSSTDVSSNKYPKLISSISQQPHFHADLSAFISFIVPSELPVSSFVLSGTKYKSLFPRTVFLLLWFVFAPMKTLGYT